MIFAPFLFTRGIQVRYAKYLAATMPQNYYISIYKSANMHNRIFTPVKYLLSFVALFSAVNQANALCVATDSIITTTLCSGDTFYVGSHGYTQTNTYTDTLTNANGCDSVVTLNLTVIQPIVVAITDSVCAGDTFHFNGRNITASGNYTDTITATSTGCDSITTLNLTVIAPILTSIHDTICTGDTIYFNGNAYTTSGSHKDTLTAISGCDSIVTLNVLVRPVLTSAISQSICRGGSYNFNGITLNQPGNYKDTLTNQLGCDSVVTLTLNYAADVAHNVSATICAGNSFIFNGDTLIYSGIYNDTLVSSTGCDSLVVLNLDILPNPLEPYIVTSGDTLIASYAPSYQWLLNGNVLPGDTLGSIAAAQAGNYQVEIIGPNGCRNMSAVYTEYASGINELSGNWDVRLYPNPNQGSFTISFTDKLNRNVQITDALGRVIIADEVVGGTKEFNLANLAGGVYFTRIKQQDEIKTIRFVIAR